MKFELLASEIILDCLEYLNAWEIFYSFDQLNSRLNRLIRCIPLHLTYQHHQKLMFDQFCLKMLANPEIKNQISSLQISNQNSYDQLRTFLSWFSLEEFPYLQALSFTTLGEHHIQKLKGILPKLSHFCLLQSEGDAKELLSLIPISKLRSLSLTELIPDENQYSSMTHLTLSCSYLDDLCLIFENAPMLEYLNVKNISKHNALKTSHAVHLKQMMLINFQCSFEDLEVFLSQTSNLEYLSITTEDKEDMIDASRWQYLITSSLPQLISFKFEFRFSHKDGNNIIFHQYKQFQTDFWQKQHQWYIIYSSDDYSSIIHTIPSISPSYILDLPSKEYSNDLLTIFDHVKELSLFYGARLHKCPYYFSNVTSLTLSYARFSWNGGDDDKKEFVRHLQRIVNLSNLKHLDISRNWTEETAWVLLEILKNTLKLSSLTFELSVLEAVFNNDKLCKYLNERIRKLDICGEYLYSLDTLEEVERFCQLFSNIQSLKYNIHKREHLLYLLNHLSHLFILEVYVSSDDEPEHFLSWFKGESLKLHGTYHIEELAERQKEYFIDKNAKNFCIWIAKNFHEI